MKKYKIIIILSIIVVPILFFLIYATIMTYGNQRMPEVEVPLELKQLEKVIQKETNYNEADFDPLSPFELERCEANLYMYIYIKNDTINASEENLSSYVKTISNRINEVLKQKKCYKKLTVKTSSENDKHLKNYNHHFEFPIK